MFSAVRIPSPNALLHIDQFPSKVIEFGESNLQPQISMVRFAKSNASYNLITRWRNYRIQIQGAILIS